ncbi:MAG TPA: M2 family metallopeptidase [Steroidobacteraceae bacterium]|nr:M2 family metallopeptidase [Steroidobacteraceae bacterium]
MTAAVLRKATVLCLAGVLSACGSDGKKDKTADEFVARANGELLEIGKESARAGWVQLTYITPDTEALAAKATEREQAVFAKVIAESKAFDGDSMSEESTRAIALLRLALDAPAPDDPAKRAELAELETRLTSMYGAGKYCPSGPESCRNIDQISATLASSRDWDEQLEAWTGWHTISPPMRKDYQRFVELANEGARGLGFDDLGELWRAGYDMTPAEFEAETERLWSQVKPLYDGLHCYARGKLQQRYGKERVPDGKPMPAHLFGNIWAQQWNNIYDLLEPYPGVSNLDVAPALKKQGYDAKRMTESAESFYVSLGFPKLPPSFWERSMLVRPADRDVVCHASAHNMDGAGDVRIKQCIQPTEEELYTIYHELGHIYYYLSYTGQPYLFQDGAHDGFHEAVGDAVNLSMTDGYLASVGLLPKSVKSGREAVINRQMKVASEKIAFLPFGKLVDQWRWGVFSGAITPDRYNEAWWDLRRKYQGVDAPVERTEADFDPGAKYHIPGNTPYTRYFLSFVLQFQFHRALCAAAGFQGPLHECSVFGSSDAGRGLQEMLALGRSRPWQDALEKLTGTRQMDATAIIEYFQPLMGWLEEQNSGRECGW